MEQIINEYHQAKENLAYTSQRQGKTVLLVYGTPGNSKEWLKTTSLLKDSFQLFMPESSRFQKFRFYGRQGLFADGTYQPPAAFRGKIYATQVPPGHS